MTFSLFIFRTIIITRREFLGADAVLDGQLVTNSAPDLGQHFKRKPGPVLLATAVRVGPPVVQRRGPLAQAPVVSTVEEHHIETGAQRPVRGRRVLVDQFVDVVLRTRLDMDRPATADDGDIRRLPSFNT